jgi:hypothetical protein
VDVESNHSHKFAGQSKRLLSKLEIKTYITVSENTTHIGAASSYALHAADDAKI